YVFHPLLGERRRDEAGERRACRARQDRRGAALTAAAIEGQQPCRTSFASRRFVPRWRPASRCLPLPSHRRLSPQSREMETEKDRRLRLCPRLGEEPNGGGPLQPDRQ